MMKISYLGPKGSYTNIAAQNIFETNSEFIPASTITNAIHDLASGLVDQAIVPIENSIAGGVAETVDVLKKTENIYIINETILPISHCLMAIKGKVDKNNLSAITKLTTHQQSAGQCLEFIRKNLPNAQVLQSPSNSHAAQSLKQRFDAGENVENELVIASKLCAEIYDLEILAEGINDASVNETRFWILSKTLAEYNAATKNKTTILFQTKDEPGSLQQVLRLFAVNHVNLSRIESRPAKKNIGEYLFLIDFDLHKEDQKYDELMRQARQHFTYYKWLGSYSLLK